jgi:ketosteroid isomerase-like protein
MARTTEQVFHDHVLALERGDLHALMADYAEDAVLVTMDGVYVGREAIQGFFIGAFSSMPNLKLTGTGEHVYGDVVLCSWTADSTVASIPTGVDSFVIRDDKIRLQTGWFTVAPK